MTNATPHAAHIAAGKKARAQAPRSSQASYEPPSERDPLGIIERQNVPRFEPLVPLRMARMAQSPFAFFRGTAALQAADLAASVNSGHYVVASGDAHLSNFGIYAASDRTLVFDLNDFDEAGPAPWEWDLKRLVTSMVLAARDNGLPEGSQIQIAEACARAYRLSVHRIGGLSAIDRYYQRQVAEAGPLLDEASVLALEHTLKAARKRTSERVAAKIMEVRADGTQRIKEQPPRTTHVEAELAASAGNIIDQYRTTVRPDIAVLLSQYELTDVARRVVGVGSVGTRCYIAVFTGPQGEPLILQMKEAGRSVLDEFGGVGQRLEGLPEHRTSYAEGGDRVVAFQQVLQATSDPFLGYVRSQERGFYIRQFRDFNVSFEISELAPPALQDYGQACAIALARAHVQSPGAGFIAGYLGKNGSFDRAVTTWSLAYADQSLADFEAFTAAIAAGRFPTTDLV